MDNLTKNEIDYALAKERVNQLKKFYASLAVFLIVFIVYSLRKYFKTGDIVFLNGNNFSVIFWIWGIILAIKASKIFFFNQSWERRMMNKELNK